MALMINSGRMRVNYGDLSGADLRDLHDLSRRFMIGSAEVDELPIDTIKHIKETYRQLRSIHISLQSELEQTLHEHVHMTDEKIKVKGCTITFCDSKTLNMNLVLSCLPLERGGKKVV